MSLIIPTVYKDDAGVHHNPPILSPDPVNVHVDIDGKLVPKTVREVMIKWVTSSWVIQSVYSAGTKFAIEVTDPSDDSTAFYDYPLNDFIAAQCCASPDPE